MSNLVLFTVIDIVLLIAGLAIYLWIVGGQLTRIATNLEECNDLVLKIGGNAASIDGNLEHVNRTGGVVAGALPLLYGMAEKIVVGATYDPKRCRSVVQQFRLPDAAAHVCMTPSAACRTARGAGPTPPLPTRPSLRRSTHPHRHP